MYSPFVGIFTFKLHYVKQTVMSSEYSEIPKSSQWFLELSPIFLNTFSYLSRYKNLVFNPPTRKIVVHITWSRSLWPCRSFHHMRSLACLCDWKRNVRQPPCSYLLSTSGIPRSTVTCGPHRVGVSLWKQFVQTMTLKDGIMPWIGERKERHSCPYTFSFSYFTRKPDWPHCTSD